MIICFNCDKKTKSTLDSLINSGQYIDYAEVISIAVANLAVLERNIGEQGVLLFNADHADDNKTEPGRIDSYQIDAGYAALENEPASRRDSRPRLAEPEIPFIFRLNQNQGALNVSKRLAKLPADVWVSGEKVPLDRWVFGQYNRLLPAKASCRAIVHLLEQTGSDRIDLDEAGQLIAKEATGLGNFLASHDERYDLDRDKLLSTAFPTSGENCDKSQLRYANQFVGAMNKEGQISGLLVALKFINSVGRKGSGISLTQAGWSFAKLPNPVLDKSQEDPAQKFSEEEIEFLLDHIERQVPAEDYAYRTILTAIKSGADTPDDIDEALQDRVPLSSGRDLSASFLSSQRSGAISRMTDLRLVNRVREGVRVHYATTKRGLEFVASSRS